MIPVVEVMVGPVSSGKSTYSKIAANRGWVVINDDALVLAVHGGDYKLYEENLKPLYKSIENHILSTAIAMGKSVVVDRGLNCSAESRKRWVALAKSLDAEPRAVVFANEGPEVHALRRADSDGRGYGSDYWLRVAKAHAERYSDPTLSEGFKEIKYVSWDAIQRGDLW